MSRSMLHDAFAHHVWATDQLIDACSELTDEQLGTPVPGTYGSIAETIRHLVRADAWYLTFFRQRVAPVEDDAELSLAELRSVMAQNGAVWMEVIEEETDPDREVTEIDDGWEIQSPVGARLAQAVHHGTDHRSQICTVLTGLGRTPPEIDVWAHARATGREKSRELPARAADQPRERAR